MAVAMKSQNPEAQKRLENNESLPRVSEMIPYYPRPSEVRARMEFLPAIVMRRDESNRLLDLLVFMGQDDSAMLERVPERRGEDRGWVASGGYVTKERFNEIMDDVRRTLFGDAVPPENMGSMFEAFGNLWKEIDSLKFEIAKLGGKRP